MLRDDTASVKLVLWEKYVETLEAKSTYDFHNLRLKVGKNERFLNTPKSGEYKAKPSAPFEKPLAEFEDISSTTASIHCKILGIQQCLKKLACISCFKKVKPDDDNTLGDCESCKLTQVLEECPVLCTMRILVQDQERNKLRLTFHQQAVDQLMAIVQPDIKIGASTTEKDIKLILLKGGKQLTITYDTVEFKVLTVQQ